MAPGWRHTAHANFRLSNIGIGEHDSPKAYPASFGALTSVTACYSKVNSRQQLTAKLDKPSPFMFAVILCICNLYPPMEITILCGNKTLKWHFATPIGNPNVHAHHEQSKGEHPNSRYFSDNQQPFYVILYPYCTLNRAMGVFFGSFFLFRAPPQPCRNSPKPSHAR